MAEDPDLVGIVDWINTEPLSLEPSSANGATLVDFWTYTCVNCIRTFPFLKALHQRYAGQGLTVIGVHSPEFEFERDPANVRSAAQRYELPYPIAVDSDKATWDLFGNHFWPSTYLFDADGELVYNHFGEGGYDHTEAAVRKASKDGGRDLSGVDVLGEVSVSRAEGAHTVTRQIYTGYGRAYEPRNLFAAQEAYYFAPDSTELYEDSRLRRCGQFELKGLWRNERDGIAHARRTNNRRDYILLPFFGASANAVINPGDSRAVIEVQLDGKPLHKRDAGMDIDYSSDGRSLVTLDTGRMYALMDLEEFGQHELKVIVRAAGVKIHDFTFGGYETGP